jgi:hypothetical protein
MKMNTTYSPTCTVECLENGKTLEAEIDKFMHEEYMSVYLNTVKINLQYDTKVNLYIGKMAGLEFGSKGPKKLGSWR